MQRVEKERKIRGLESRLGGAKCLYLTDFTGLDVAEITELRRRLSEAGVSYVVVKNTLARRALAEGPWEGLRDELSGPSAFAWSDDDVVSPAKILSEFADEREKPRIKAGAIEGRVVSLEEIGRIAKLPPREELLSKLVGSARSPVSGLVWTLHGLLAQFVRTLDAVRAKVEREGPAEPVVEDEPATEEPGAEEEPAAEEAPTAEAEAATEEEADDDRPEASTEQPEASEDEEEDENEDEEEDDDEKTAATASAEEAAEEDDEEAEEDETAPDAESEK